jgi:hypothetical protein
MLALAKRSKSDEHAPAPEEVQRSLGIEWQKPVSSDSTQGYVPIGKSLDEENVKK